jgi:hypothetical protein
MEEGWIKLHRSLIKWEWYNDIPTKVLFIHFLISCNHADANYRGRKILRGQRWTSIGHLANETGLTVKQVRAAIEKLQTTGEILTQGASDGTMVTVCKYDSYQEIQKPNGKQSGEQRASDRQAEGQTKGNKQECNNNSLEEIEQKELSVAEPPHTLIVWINEKAPTIQKLKEPLTSEQAEKILLDLNIDTTEKKKRLCDMMLAMENYKPLLSKSKSANLTIRNWWKRELERMPIEVAVPKVGNENMNNQIGNLRFSNPIL